MFKRLKLAWRMSRQMDWVDEPNWLPEDGEALRRFMTGDTGRKLALILRNQVVRQALWATAEKSGLDNACGYANGFRGAVGLLDSLQPQEDFPNAGE